MDEEELANKLADYLNEKYEDYLKKRGKKYDVSRYETRDGFKLYIGSGSDLPSVSIFSDGRLKILSHYFWGSLYSLDSSFRSYEVARRILDEIKHRENWQKYRYDKKVGDDILLYEQAEEIVREVNEKYGTNIVLVIDEKTGYAATLSMRGKTEEEIMKEVERNFNALNEALILEEKIEDHFTYEFLLSEGIPNDLVETVRKQIKEKYRSLMLPKHIPVILKYKLKYLPIILATSMLGPQRIGKDVSFPFTFGKLKWTWSNEDQEVFEELKDKVEVRTERRTWKTTSIDYLREEQAHIFWPIKILELEEVREEVERARNEKLFSSKDEMDVELLKNVELIKDIGEGLKSKSVSEKRRIVFLIKKTNRDVKVQMNKFYEILNDVKNQIRDNFWFAFVFVGETLKFS